MYSGYSNILAIRRGGLIQTIAIVAPPLQEESRNLRKENNDLRKENSDLQKENSDLRKEII